MYPTPSLPFRTEDEKDDVAPDSREWRASEEDAGHYGGWKALLQWIERRGEVDGYEGMQGVRWERPPKWRFRWGKNGERLPPEVAEL